MTAITGIPMAVTTIGGRIPMTVITGIPTAITTGHTDHTITGTFDITIIPESGMMMTIGSVLLDLRKVLRRTGSLTSGLTGPKGGSAHPSIGPFCVMINQKGDDLKKVQHKAA